MFLLLLLPRLLFGMLMLMLPLLSDHSLFCENHSQTTISISNVMQVCYLLLKYMSSNDVGGLQSALVFGEQCRGSDPKKTFQVFPFKEDTL